MKMIKGKYTLISGRIELTLKMLRLSFVCWTGGKWNSTN
jgi:hypothetical protein